MRPPMQQAQPQMHASIYDLATRLPLPACRDTQALHRIFSFDQGHAQCRVSPELSSKYGLPSESSQLVLSVTDRVLGAQAWFNAERGRKPQTFGGVAAAELEDPTDGGATCDFCRWQTMTAEDSFGRIERVHAVTASNLFKYCQPCHGLVLLKKHHPLQFTLPELADLLVAAEGWFQRAAAEHPAAQHPFLLWNCGARAGASQFHGHAQVLLSEVPLPACEALTAAAARYAQSAQPDQADYYEDLACAHRAAGLLHEHETSDGHRAVCYASMAPMKDMELCIQGRSLSCGAFQALLFAALRALIDGLGSATFNVGVYNIACGRADRSSSSSEQPGTSGNTPGTYQPDGAADAGLVPLAGISGRRPPVVARVVSRGRPHARASDYGGLEIFGHASIGHTDPYRVFEALQVQAQALGVT